MTEPWILAIFATLATVQIGLQSWILITLFNHERQIYRLVSDRESEKGTISRVHSDFEIRLRALERKAT